MNRQEAENYLHKKIEDGELISPVLPEGVKNYLIDIDGTICDDIPNEEPERMSTAKLYPDALETLNRWYDEISSRDAVKRGYDLLKKGDLIPKA